MGDGSLSQEEIDALLTDVDDTLPKEGSNFAAAVKTPLSETGKYSVVFLAFAEGIAAASEAITTLVGKKITFTNVKSSVLDKISIAGQLEIQSAMASAQIGGVSSLLVLNPKQARQISMNIMGATNEPSELDEAHLSSITELCGTLFSTIATYIGQKIFKNLELSTPKVKIFNNKSDLPDFSSANVIRINFDIALKDVPLGKLDLFIDESGVKEWSKNQYGGERDNLMDDLNPNSNEGQDSADLMQGFKDSSVGEPQSMNPVNFPTFQTGSSLPANISPNYELLLDVQMVLTVELGRTTEYVKDVLKLGEGSIIELDKLAGEPVDILINGKLIAKGEVVVIDENFGVRVTDIVGPAERLAKISSSS